MQNNEINTVGCRKYQTFWEHRLEAILGSVSENEHIHKYLNIATTKIPRRSFAFTDAHTQHRSVFKLNAGIAKAKPLPKTFLLQLSK